MCGSSTFVFMMYYVFNPGLANLVRSTPAHVKVACQQSCVRVVRGLLDSHFGSPNERLSVLGDAWTSTTCPTIPGSHARVEGL
jgi:hypothetical protein